MGFLLKIAIFAVVAYAAWATVRRWYGALGGGQPKAPPPAKREPPAEAPRPPVIEEARLCPVCTAYVSVAGAKCGRSDCPQPA
jgi:hypothetical protein